VITPDALLGPLTGQPAMSRPWIAVGLVVGCATYAVMTRPRRGLARAPASRRRLWAFVASCLVLWPMLDGPLRALGDTSMWSLHAATTLLAVGLWAPLLLWAVPMRWWTWLQDDAPSARLTGPAVRALCSPWNGFLLFNIAMAIRHLPGFHELSCHHEGWRLVGDGLVLLSGVAFWMPLIRPAPGIDGQRALGRTVYLIAHMVPLKGLGIFVSMHDTLLYPHYGAVSPRPWGISALLDQQLGGLLLWVPGGLLMWFALAFLFQAWATRGTPRRGLTGVPEIDRSRVAQQLVVEAGERDGLLWIASESLVGPAQAAFAQRADEPWASAPRPDRAPVGAARAHRDGHHPGAAHGVRSDAAHPDSGTQDATGKEQT
jgi:cytochrome c oxidase assembly factor CtaG